MISFKASSFGKPSNSNPLAKNMNTTETLAEPVLAGTLHPKTILVPIDFSDEAKKALRYAASFAKQFGSTLHLVHVVEPVPYLSGMEAAPIMTSDAELELLGKAKLAAIGTSECAQGIPSKTEIRRGSPYREIVEAARENGAELVVIATHGRTGWEHALLGSTAERVVQYAPCPVLVIRDQEREFIE